MINIVECHPARTVSYRVRSTIESCTRGNFEWTVHWPGQEIEDPIALDLLEIAKGIHLADRMFRRSSRLGQRTREIIVRVPVRQPGLWKREVLHLESLVRFTSVDNWRLEFTHAPQLEKRKPSKKPRSASSVVALFSGGLDSLCGAAYLAALRNENPIFVSHSPPGQENNLRLIQGVWKAHGRVPVSPDQCVTFRLKVRERDTQGLRSMFQEHSRRTRPFFFLALACAVAVDQQIPAVQMSENGALGMSLPMRADAYGAQCTRQAHIHMLQGFAELLNRIIPLPHGWRIYNPFEDMTKGEACQLLKKASPLSKDAISCEYVGHQAAFLRSWIDKHPAARARFGKGPQCGICTPCLIRRAALYRAGISDPDERYFFNACRVLYKGEMLRASYLAGDHQHHPPLYEAASPQVFFIRRFCDAVRSMSDFEFAIQYFPELRYLADTDEHAILKLRQCHHLIKKLASETIQFLDSSR